MLEMTTRAQNALKELSLLQSKPDQLKKERDKLESLLSTASQKHEKAIVQICASDLSHWPLPLRIL